MAMTTPDLKARLTTFLEDLTQAMGIPLQPEVTESDDAYLIDLQGEGGEALLRQKGEGLRAIQQIVSLAFRKQAGDDRRIVVDCQNFRRDKDLELKHMARFLAEKARRTGVPQEIGPLNAYERRIVHLTVAEEPGMTSESIGDAAVKTVIISAQ
jgi:spoIIIJ-associated protein